MGKEMRKGEASEVRVWDLPMRVLHWTNAIIILVLVALILGHEWFEDSPIGEDMGRLHAYLGHVLAITLAFRLIWGFLGNEYSRWRDIIPFTAEQRRKIAADIKWAAGGFRGRSPAYVGHNPLASLLYIVLFVFLIGQVASGVILSGEEYGTFPGKYLVAPEAESSAGVAEKAPYVADHLDFDDDHDNEHELGEQDNEGHESEGGEEVIEEFHEFGLYFIYVYLILHIGGLIVHEVTSRRGLLRAMITGRKRLSAEDVEELGR